MANDDGDAEVVPIDPDLPSPQTSESPAPSRTSRRRGRAQVDVLAAIAAGGAFGGPARYGMAQLIHVAKDGFPWATFWTNVSGSLALGFLLVLIIERFPPTRYVRPFFAIGFLGAYTTFSTFAVETDLLIKARHFSTAALYAAGSLVGGVVAAWAGILLARLLAPGERSEA